MFEGFEHVQVLPFVGERYKRETPWGVPILIVGESHYSNNGEPLSPEFDLLDGGGTESVARGKQSRLAAPLNEIRQLGRGSRLPSAVHADD